VRNNPKQCGGPFGPPHFLAGSSPRRPSAIILGSHFLRANTLQTDIVGDQRILDTLRVNTPARLDRDILRAVHFICDRHSHDAGVGLLLPKQFARLGIEGPEIAVVGSADGDEIARGRRH
jgi:hypothetical protein